jgi:hypothetical protein
MPRCRLLSNAFFTPTADKKSKNGYLLKVVVRSHRSSPGCAQSAGKLYILLLYGNALGVDGAQIRVVEEVDKESFSGLLERHDSLALPSGRTVLSGDLLANLAHLCGH